jgi:hypothetical protein
VTAAPTRGFAAQNSGGAPAEPLLFPARGGAPSAAPQRRAQSEPSGDASGAARPPLDFLARAKPASKPAPLLPQRSAAPPQPTPAEAIPPQEGPPVRAAQLGLAGGGTGAGGAPRSSGVQLRTQAPAPAPAPAAPPPAAPAPQTAPTVTVAPQADAPPPRQLEQAPAPAPRAEEGGATMAQQQQPGEEAHAAGSADAAMRDYEDAGQSTDTQHDVVHSLEQVRCALRMPRRIARTCMSARRYCCVRQGGWAFADARRARRD